MQVVKRMNFNVDDFYYLLEGLSERLGVRAVLSFPSGLMPGFMDDVPADITDWIHSKTPVIVLFKDSMPEEEAGTPMMSRPIFLENTDLKKTAEKLLEEIVEDVKKYSLI